MSELCPNSKGFWSTGNLWKALGSGSHSLDKIRDEEGRWVMIVKNTTTNEPVRKDGVGVRVGDLMSSTTLKAAFGLFHGRRPKILLSLTLKMGSVEQKLFKCLNKKLIECGIAPRTELSTYKDIYNEYGGGAFLVLTVNFSPTYATRICGIEMDRGVILSKPDLPLSASYIKDTYGGRKKGKPDLRAVAYTSFKWGWNTGKVCGVTNRTTCLYLVEGGVVHEEEGVVHEEEGVVHEEEEEFVMPEGDEDLGLITRISLHEQGKLEIVLTISERCPICQVEFTRGDTVNKFSTCHHVYHAQCLEKCWEHDMYTKGYCASCAVKE